MSHTALPFFSLPVLFHAFSAGERRWENHKLAKTGMGWEEAVAEELLWLKRVLKPSGVSTLLAEPIDRWAFQKKFDAGFE